MAGNDKQGMKQDNLPGQGSNQGGRDQGNMGSNQDVRQSGNPGSTQSTNQPGSQSGGKAGSSQSDTGGRSGSTDPNRQRDMASDDGRDAGNLGRKNDINQQGVQGNPGSQPNKK